MGKPCALLLNKSGAPMPMKTEDQRRHDHWLISDWQVQSIGPCQRAYC
jgi:hypothetical protein